MELVETALSSLHPSFYAMLSLTILPMILPIPRALTLAYLVCYAVAGVWVLYRGLADKPVKQNMGARMDDRVMSVFRNLKIQDL